MIPMKLLLLLRIARSCSRCIIGASQNLIDKGFGDEALNI